MKIKMIKKLSFIIFFGVIIIVPKTSLAWWDTSWLNRRTITFTGASTTASSLTDFPIAVILNATSSANIDYSKTQNSGQDIRFVDSDDTTALQYEIEKWDEATTSVAWVMVPNVATSQTDFVYMYYNNTAAVSAATTTGVWATSTVAVFHLPDNLTASSTDSTRYYNNGLMKDGVSATSSGQFDGAQVFDGVDDFVNVGSVATYEFGSNSFAVSLWFKQNSPGSNPRVIARLNGVGNVGWDFNIGSGTSISWDLSNDATNYISIGATLSPGLNQWHHAVGVVDRTANQGLIYIDGVFKSSGSIVSTSTFNGTGINLNFGRNSGGGNQFSGIIDDVRIYKRALSAAEIEAQYKLGVNTYLTYGSEESVAAATTLTQNAYRIYENRDAIQPDYALGTENASTTVAQGEAFRVRMGLTIGGANLASSTNKFKLQFNTASSTTGWTDVGKIASTSALFRGYNNGSVNNNATTTAVLLSSSIKRGTYQEEWMSDLGHEGANIGQDLEYDWVVLEQAATTSINYYFRMINSDDTALTNYNRHAIVTVRPRTYTQRDYQWFSNTDSLTPGTNLNQINTGIGSVTSNDVRRLRIDMSVGNIVLATSSKKFMLQYKTLGSGCGAAESWTAVGAISSGEIWRGFNNSSVADGATTTSVYLNSANRFETYQEQNNTASSTSRIELGQSGEYDWVIQDNSAALDTTYCFRMATTTGTGAFDTYSNYPRLITANYQPTVVTGGSATDASVSGVYQIPTTTPSGGGASESSGGGTPTTTPNPGQGGGGGDSGYGPNDKFFASIGSFGSYVIYVIKEYWLIFLFFIAIVAVLLKNSKKN